MNIQDIARLAGVSASTVSKVMNGKDRDISEETKKKVLKVIEEKHYVPYFRICGRIGPKTGFRGDNRLGKEGRLRQAGKYSGLSEPDKGV